MKRKLLFAIVALLCSVGTWAYQTPTANGIYYIQNVETGKFLCRGNGWGTRAIVSDYGSTWQLIEDNGRYHVRVASLVAANVNQGLGDDYWMYADCSGDRDRTYQLTLVSDGQYTLTGSGISQNVYAYTKEDGDKYCVAGNATLNDNMTVISQSYWRFLSQSEYDAVIASRISAQENLVASTAGYDLATLGKSLEQLVTDANSFANKGAQATVIAVSGWTWTPETNRNGGTATGNGLIEAFKSPGKFTKTLTGLAEGIYKVSIPALFRESDNASCYSLHESGFETAGGCYISANGNTTKVASWASGATNNNYPNSMEEAKARIDAGAYSNEVYCYVGASGELNLEVSVPGFYEISEWVGSWFIMGDATATLYSDAVSDGDATTILAQADGLLDDEMDPTILSNLSSARSAFNSSRTISDYNTLHSVILEAQASADAYALFAVERTKALALGMPSEAIAELAPDVHALMVAEYNFVTDNYSYGVSLGTWAKTNAIDRSGQHWDGSDGSTYSEQNEGWGSASWTCSYSQNLTLPAGDYVFKVAGRKSSDSAVLTLTVRNGETPLGTVNDFPNGDTGKGIDTSGATNFGDGTYANNGTGRGWQWRYVKFTLEDPATVTVAVTGSASAQQQWVGFCNATVQTNDEDNVDLMTSLVNLNSAITSATLSKNTTNVGTGVFQLNETTNNTLWSAYETAKSNAEGYTLTSSSTADEVDALTAALNTAMDNYKFQAPNAPEVGKHYYIKVATAGHAKNGNAVVIGRQPYPVMSGNYISDQTGFTFNASAAPAAYLAQAVTFKQVEGNTYNIAFEREEGTVYMTYGALNDSKVNWKNQQIQGTTETAKKGEFKIVATPTANVFKIYNTIDNNYIDCQDGGSLYTDGNIEKDLFTIAEASQASVTVSCKAGKYGTVIFPFTPDVSTGFDGITFYSIEGINDVTNRVLLNEVATPVANTPYLIKNTSGEDFSKAVTGWGAAYKDSYDSGDTDIKLTGVYKAATIAASVAATADTDGAYRYVLQTQDATQAFYKVDADFTATAYKCYLTVKQDKTGSGVKAFFLDFGDADAVNDIEAAQNENTIYNLAGQRVSKAQKGLYIVNGKKVMVK